MLAALFLIPDVVMLGYLINSKVGALCYNFAHSYAMAGGALLAIYLLGGHFPIPLLVWPIHIAVDRTIGYGLKSSRGFRLTHLSAQMDPATGRVVL